MSSSPWCTIVCKKCAKSDLITFLLNLCTARSVNHRTVAEASLSLLKAVALDVFLEDEAGFLLLVSVDFSFNTQVKIAWKTTSQADPFPASSSVCTIESRPKTVRREERPSWRFLIFSLLS